MSELMRFTAISAHHKPLSGLGGRRRAALRGCDFLSLRRSSFFPGGVFLARLGDGRSLLRLNGAVLKQGVAGFVRLHHHRPEKIFLVAGDIQVVLQVENESIQRGQIVNAEVKDTVIGQHEFFLLGIGQSGHNIAVRFCAAEGEQRFIQAVAGENNAVLVDHDGANLTEHFDGAAELFQLLVGVHSDVPIRSPQLGQRLFYDLHACTPFKKARALSIFSAAARTMPGSIS